MNDPYERSDLNVRSVAGFGVVLAAVVALALVVVAAFLHPSRTRPLRPAVTSPAPRLQEHAREELAKLRAAEDAVLNDYGWVDRKAGIIRIPIERAMELTAQRGLPARAAKPEVKP